MARDYDGLTHPYGYLNSNSSTNTWCGSSYGYGSSCVGTISVTLQWVPDPSKASDPHPNRVLLSQYSHASYSGGSVPGDGSDGLGDPWLLGYDPYYGAYESSSGQYYSVVDDGSGTITFECSPYALAGNRDVYDNAYFNIQCGVFYSVSAYSFQDCYLDVSVTSAKVAGLAFNASDHLQEAGFAVKATAKQRNEQLFPSGAYYTYQWSSPSSGGPLQYAAPTTAGYNLGTNQTVATATGPCLAYPTCMAVVKYNNLYFVYSNSAQCAAIGGPLTTEVNHPKADYSTTYDHDGNDPTKPFYMTYLGYPHTQTIDKNTQPTQDVTLRAMAQPTGTTVTFGPISSTLAKGFVFTMPDPGGGGSAGGDDGDGGDGGTVGIGDPPENYNGGAPQPPGTVTYSETLYAEAAFENAVPTAHFHFDNGVGLVGDADDDSATTQDPVKDKDGNVTGWKAHIYAMSAHAPGSLVDVNDPSVRPANGAANDPRLLPPNNPESRAQPSGCTYWTDTMRYRYTLLDTKGARMPGVWVQERFTDNDPYGLKVNQTNMEYWPTLLFSVLNSGQIDARDGMFGAARADSPGSLLVYDGLYYTWPGTTATTITTTHAYYAGSRDATGNLTTGVYLGTYTITFTPGSQPNTIGTARQTIQPPQP